MRARDLAEEFPIVGLDTDVFEAARVMAERRLPGLIVCDEAGTPHTVLPGSQVLRFLIPGYIQDDPRLARALSEKASDELCRKLVATVVRDLLPRAQDRDELPVVDGDATPLEIAAVMARMHSPLVAVVDGGSVRGAVVVSRLLQHLLPSTPPAAT